jgi:hypothetical protein
VTEPLGNRNHRLTAGQQHTRVVMAQIVRPDRARERRALRGRQPADGPAEDPRGVVGVVVRAAAALAVEERAVLQRRPLPDVLGERLADERG